MFNSDGQIPHQQNQPQEPQPRCYRPYVQILEQPAPKSHRFRYTSEGRTTGSIPGASSTPGNKTFPAIQIVGYQGKAIVVVSCVTADPPYRPHPHKLVGRQDCSNGTCISNISPETMRATFPNLGIQCMKKKEIKSSLRLREKYQIDPFRTGFSHLNELSTISLNTVRLCFQVFIEIGVQCKIPLEPVISNPICDKRSTYLDLSIIKLSDSVSYVDGGNKDIILLCEKVMVEDIQVRLWEEKDGQLLWEGFADFKTTDVYKKIAISFRTPSYRTINITEPVSCFIQLRRPSNGAVGKPLEFQLLPLDSVLELNMVKPLKKRKIHDPNAILTHLKNYEKHRQLNYNALNIEMDRQVNDEPQGTTPSTSTNIRVDLGGTSTMNIGSSLLNINSQELKELAFDIIDKDPLMSFSNLSLSDINL